LNHVTLDALDAIELAGILEFFAGWLRADVDVARNRLPLRAYRVDDVQVDTARLIKILQAS
jgi:hypothetical protein